MPFDTLDQAIRLANDCDLALTSSVWTSDMKLGKYIAERMEAGTTTINDHLFTHGCSELPWGGWKLSGLGRTVL
jgi:succinate-semialdehyde dehydrogenase/glutarate-semialdehyde dehydrogenase